MSNAQRARLVIAMGVLNLILATVALTAGFVGPIGQDRDIAAVQPTPAPATSVPSSAPQATPSPTEPSASEPAPSVEPPPIEPSGEPSVEPSAAAPSPSEGPIVAGGPTPTPDRTASPQTPAPPAATPAPTQRPTPKPTPTPKPVESVDHKPRPPCPGSGDGPPGHNKTLPPPSRPCGHGGGNQRGSGSSGLVVVLPLALGGFAASARTWLTLSSRRVARSTRSKVTRRRTRSTPPEE